MPRCQAAAAAMVAMALVACGEPAVPIPRATPQLTVFTDSLEVRVSPTRAPQVVATVLRLDVPPAVTIRTSGVPAGVVATIGSVDHDGQVTTVPITFAGDVTAEPGLYTITITASSSGAEDATSQLKLRVAELVRVSFAGCAVADRPLWFAVQDGNGPLRQLQPVGEEYRFAPDVDHAGFYYVVTEADSFSTRGTLQTTAELLEAPIVPCDPAPGAGIPLTGNLIGAAGLEHTRIMAGGTAVSRVGNGDFVVMSGPGPTEDLLAMKFGFLPGAPNRILIRRDVDVTTGSLGTLDLNAGAPGTHGPQTALMTFNDLPQYVISDVSFHTGASCTGVDLYSGMTTSSSSPSSYRRYWGVPLGVMRENEWHRLRVGGHFPNRSVTIWTRDIQPLQVDLGPEPAYPDVTRLAAGPGLRFAIDMPNAYDREAVFTYTTWRPLAHEVRVTASRGWLAMEDDTFTAPDFRATPGWNTGWEPDFSTFDVHWTARLIGGPGGAPCTPGLHDRDVEWWGTSWAP